MQTSIQLTDDDIVILPGTGVRVSELYGLTKSDIGFERGYIHVQRQLCRTADKPYFITTPKTSSGNRCIPMTAIVRETFKRIFASRGFPKVEMLVDGCSGFLFLDKDEKLDIYTHTDYETVEQAFRRVAAGF